MPKLCPITESIKIIGTKPRMFIVRYLDGNSPNKITELSFNELKKQCELSSRTLALNLKYLLKKKVVSVRRDKNRKFYSLTNMGEELQPIIREIGKWGNKWDVYNKN